MSKKPVKPSSDLTRPNTIGLRQEALSQLLDQIDASAGKSNSAAREFVRFDFRRESVEVTFQQPGGGNSISLKLACRNISCGGMSVLHSAYVHVGTKVRVHFKLSDGESLASDGTVVRCAHLSGLVHELGIKFSMQIQARDLVSRDPFADSFSIERVDPEKLKGTIVYVDDSAAERRLIAHYLRGTCLRLKVAATGEEGLKLVEEGCELIACDFELPGFPNGSFVRRIRDAGFDTSIIVVTADPTAVTRSSLNSLRINAFLAKPFRQEMFLRAIAEFMSNDSGGKQSTCSLSPDHPNRALVEGYVDQMHADAKRIAALIEADSVEPLRALMLQIVGSAANYGYEAIGRLAQAAVTSLASTMNIAESLAPIKLLQSACERSRP
jgi:CheY-like chemotaxis protein